MKNIFIDSFGGNVYGVLTENNKLIEYHVESETTKKIVGNIYKGRVENIINGMQAAFVGIGLERNGYLSVGDMLIDKSELDGKIDIPSTLNLKIGDEIMVQAMKDPIANKGARLTSIISFAGRNLVFLPNMDFVGISRKITDENKREKLTEYVTKLKDAGTGFIVRTVAESATKKDLKQEAVYLKGQYNKALENFKNSKALSIVYEDGDLPFRMLRDVYTSEIDNVYVSSKEIYDNLTKFINENKKDKSINLLYYDGERDMLKTFGYSDEIKKMLDKKVELSSGAYLIFDKTEALTVIDVNTGKFTGESNLEQTVFDTNILAAKEIARQVRLRNISGIIVVDFIDMESEEHRNSVVSVLEDALKADRVKCNVMGMSSLGLVEFTRKKARNDIMSKLLKPCPYCQGDGQIFSNDFFIMKIRVDLLDKFADGYKNVIIDMNIDIAKYILSSGALSKDVNTIWQNKRVYIVPHKTFNENTYKMRGDNLDVLDVPDTARILY